MAYHRKFKAKQIAYILNLYETWKLANLDLTDTYFVRCVLPKYGHFMSYVTFMSSYKMTDKELVARINKAKKDLVR